jgi:hypothetical protein
VQDIEETIDLAGLGHGRDCAVDCSDEGSELQKASQRGSEDFD